jgi:hypothetical protein
MDVTIGPKAEKFATAFGKLAVALLFLEHALRLYLGGQSSIHQIGARGIAELKVGDLVPENSFTDASSYKDLLIRYNQAVQVDHPDWVLDQTLASLHDVVSTGRMSPLLSPHTPFVLLKFGPGSNARVEVTVAQSLSEEWLENQFSHVIESLRKVESALHGLVK